MSRMASHVVAALVAVPVVVSVMWVMSVLCIGMGLMVSYAVFAEYYGFFRTLIYGTAVNLFMAGLSCGSFYLIERKKIDWDLTLKYAVFEMMSGIIISLGYASNWSW